MKDLKLDFGAVGDDTTDDTVSVQAGLDWASANHDALYVPPGFYKITAGLSLVQRSNFRVFGPCKQAGTYNTAFRWYGSGGTMLLLDGVRDSEWTDIAFDARVSTGEPAVLIDIDKITSGGGISRKNSFRRSLLRGGALATVRISNTATTNNEANLFEDVTCSSMAGSIWQNGVPGGPVGYWIRNINAKNNQIVRGEISGKEAAVFVEQGSAHLFGTEMSGCNVWMRKGGGEPCMIERCDGDSSKTFLELLAAQTTPVEARGNRFVQGIDGPFFIWGDNAGPVVLEGNDFASGGYRPNATYTMPGNGPNLVAIGNVFPNENLLPIPGTNPPKFRSLYSLGNIHYAPGNVQKLSDSYMVAYRATGPTTSSLQIGGPSGFRGEVQAITTPTAQFVPNQSVIPFTVSHTMTLVSSPTFTNGMFEGQEVKLLHVGGAPLTIQDRLTFAPSRCALSSAAITLSVRQSVVLTWSVALGLWVQTSEVVTTL